MLARSTFTILVAGLFVPEAALAQTPVPIAPVAAPTLPPPIAGPQVPTWAPNFQSIWGSALSGPPMKSVPRWYGWQTIIPLALMDIVTLSAWAVESHRLSSLEPYEADAYGASNSSAFRFFQIAVIPVHTLAGPVVHWGNGHVREGFISLGLNISLAYLTLFPMTWSAVVSDKEILVEFAPVVSMLGVLAANAIDIAILSHDKVQVPLSEPRGARVLLPSSVALVPMLNAQQQGIALIGRF